MGLPKRRHGEIITEDDRRQAEQYVADVQALEPLLRDALDALPDFEHDLIISAYGFGGHGFSCRTNTNFDAYDEEKFAEHLRGARAMFAQNLRDRLEETELSERSRATEKILALLGRE